MTTSPEVSASVVEALQHLPEPIIFTHPSYAIVAVPCRSALRSRKTTATTKVLGGLGRKSFSSSTEDGADVVMPMAQLLFDHLLHQWTGDSKEKFCRYLKSGRSRGGSARLLATSTVALHFSVPFVTALLRCFLSHCGSCEDSLTCYVENALDFMIRWSHPSMCLTLSASVTDLQLRVSADVLYSSPLLVRPWTENVVLVAVACAPEWKLSELCCSHHIARWVHRYVTSERLDERVVATRLTVWRWLEDRLHALFSPADVILFTRTICALIFALEVELVADCSKGVDVVPRENERDREGLLLLLGILGEQRERPTHGTGRRKQPTNDEDDSNDESIYHKSRLGGCDVRRSEAALDASIAAFLRRQTTCVDFVPASRRNEGASKRNLTQVRRLCGVADELYRFLSEWIRLTVNASLCDFGTQVSLKHDGLPRLTVIVGRVFPSEGAIPSRTHPLSFLPVSLLGDMICNQQLRQATSDDRTEPLSCAAATSVFRSNARKNKSGSKSSGDSPHGGGTAYSVFDVPLWSDDDNDDNSESSVTTGAVRKSSWFVELFVGAAVRSVDESPTQWRERAEPQMRSAVASAMPGSQEKRECLSSPHLPRVDVKRVGESPLSDVLLLLMLRHAQCEEVHYALSPWYVFPSLPCSQEDRGKKKEFVTGRPKLLECFDPTLLNQKGLFSTDCHESSYTRLEAEYVDQLRRGYRRLFWRASLALEEGAEGCTAVGVHLISSPLQFERPSDAEMAKLCTAVSSSLSSRLLPRPTVGREFQVALPLSLFRARYCGLLPAAHPILRDVRHHRRRNVPDQELVETLCTALRLPLLSYRVTSSEVVLTSEGMRHLTCLKRNQQQRWAEDVPRIVTADAQRIDAKGGSVSGDCRLQRTPAAFPAPVVRRNIRHNAAPRHDGVFTSFELLSSRNVAPLQLAEWCRMIDEMLSPPLDEKPNTPPPLRETKGKPEDDYEDNEGTLKSN